ncbi:hypothetical protein Q1695_010406 [Nippostrongylus brasiliensis]|nr:hypothetical protein Q1695_010406 [Nippostrongylus brasiliensis]
MQSRSPVQNSKPKRAVDNTAEVRRRKEAAERLIKERHEALRRQHEEKIMKINEERLRQQRELKERHAKELKRQQDVLQRRMALMERDNARKKEILEKNHAVVSRLSANSSRKNYAFGSSTPRELTFIENRHLKHSPQERRSTPDNQNSPPNGSVKSIRGRPQAPAMCASMYVPSNRLDRTQQSSSVTRLSHNKVAPSKPTNMMTQSVYSPSLNSVTPVARYRKKPANELTASAPQSFKPNAIKTSAEKAKSQAKPKPGLPPKNPLNVKKRLFASDPTNVESRRRESLRSNDTHSSAGAGTTDSLQVESSIPDGVSDGTPDTGSQSGVEVVEVETKTETVAPENGHDSQHLSEAEEVPAADRGLHPDVVIAADEEHHEQTSEEESATVRKDEVVESDGNIGSAAEELISIAEVGEAKSYTSETGHAEIAYDISVEKGSTSLADELAGVFGAPSPLAPSPAPSAAEAHNESAPSPPVEPERPVAAETAPKEKQLVATAEAENNEETRPEVVPTDAGEEISAKAAETESESEIVIASPPNGTAGKDEEIEPTAEAIPMSTSPDHSEEVHTEMVTNSPPKEESNKPDNVSSNPTVNSPMNGFEKPTSAPVITAELPGTVPATKEVDESIVRKPPSPPNETLGILTANRLRREQEQRELDERKARIAAILAKSRDLSNATAVVAGRTSPPRTEVRGGTAQDVLKRLASNGNLPSLQKVLARHTAETTPIVDQFSAPEDPAPQAI